jgi:hypothetical protein
MATANFKNWIDTFVSEKGIDLEERFELEGPSGTNSFTYGVIVEHIKLTVGSEMRAIKTIIVKIDFANGDVTHFFRHIAQALVK